jgi:hypothetical protein
MKKILCVSVFLFLTGCSFDAANLQGNTFQTVWDEYASDFFYDRYSKQSYEDKNKEFVTWASEFEFKKAEFVRLNEEEEVEGMMVLLGKNLFQKREQYEIILERLQMITKKQEELKKLIRQVCQKQKTSVPCSTL